MTVWRMAFRVGSQGYEMWPHCQKLGVAAIRYDALENIDLAKYRPGEPRHLWRRLRTNQQPSLHRVAYEMKRGDVIYVKQGKRIVGRGTVKGPYKYDSKHILKDNEGAPWPHQVPVEWDRAFDSIEVLLGAEQITVLPLSGKRLYRLRQSLTSDLAFIQRSVKSDLDSLQDEEQLFEEGGKKKCFTNHYERDARLRSAAIRCHGTKCSVCSFDFARFYGEHGVGFIEVHHLRPIGTLRKKMKVNPKTDMTVVCSNCHRMIHRRKQNTLSIADLQRVIAEANQ